MPGNIIVMLTVATNLEHNDAGLVAALPFIVATVLVAHVRQFTGGLLRSVSGRAPTVDYYVRLLIRQ